ncbi:serine/threonine protein kinase [Paraferrimonas sp. SM1919]|uniref:serine/threonine protein kinase n=1 Tax=Paraferrimonas sp. SM1919 TaxID=2662263 RepID=UPI0013D1CCC2|nr:serine/threonine protein kinase [Paraferrimonas sp. SM1919]
MTAQFDYQNLSPDLILYAVEQLGIYPETGLLALNSYENRVYQFRCDRGNRYVVKFYRPQRWTQQQIQEELDFAVELANQEVPIAAPIAIDGQTLHQYQGYFFALFASVGGRSFEVDNFDQLEGVGRFLGRIHNIAQSKSFQFRPTVSVQEFGTQALSYLKQQGQLPAFLETPFFTIAEQLLNKAHEGMQSVNYKNQRLHGDLHPSNILWTADGASFVDLDDARMGPAIQDIWMMLSGDKANQLAQLDTIAEAYEEFSQFPHQQLALMEPLRALRMLHYVAWLARRANDPAFIQSFPWFYEDKYWEQQILSFKEQLAVLDEQPLSLRF